MPEAHLSQRDQGRGQTVGILVAWSVAGILRAQNAAMAESRAAAAQYNQASLTDHNPTHTLEV